MQFFLPSFRRNALVPVALAMGMVRAVLAILLMGENFASAEMPRLRKQSSKWAAPVEDVEEEVDDEYFDDEYFDKHELLEEVAPGPSLGLMRSRNTRSFLVAGRKKQTPSSSAEDGGVFEEDDSETLPPKASAKRSRANQPAPMPRPVPPGEPIPRQRYLPKGDEGAYEEEEDYDDPTCAAESSPHNAKHKRRRGDGYPGPGLPDEPLFDHSKWRIFTSPMFAHNDPADPMRHRGWGEPLYGSSWRNRPWYISPFAGGLIGDDLQKDFIRQGGNFFAGVRLGNDFDHYFGTEVRLAFSDLPLSFPTAGVSSGHSSNVAMFDGNLLYYPLGDSRWRPYWTTGIGIASFHYYDPSENKFRGSCITIPFGVGLKVKIRPAIALRFDVVDNWAIGSGDLLNSMHNVSFTGGFEWHFGGRTTNYYPW